MTTFQIGGLNIYFGIFVKTSKNFETNQYESLQILKIGRRQKGQILLPRSASK